MFALVEIFDLDSGQAQVVLDTDWHVEAPNWTRDGAALIVNAKGRLYRLPLDAPGLIPIETGFDQLNNDHGISPDGLTLAISDKTETGKSCIYTVQGGVPTRVTDKVPSWWHGWSPDGQRHTYTCVRNGDFGIATCALDGSDERLLITSAHHYDGPDYSPDGEWIWFNSDRGGDMALWRMRSDGSDVQQMTHGDSVDWFPHPSPDGQNVLYLAYPPGTEGHPFGRDVELRLMPAAGGPPQTLTHLFGGQGTLNVPCWAPDSRRFAYVRYHQTT
ncbi:TolB family protein [Tropicibacter oceani]|uniref:Biopolymer transporter Tol n=1 Tax=Tropicibacter oceani TaxID=3058420 RepID=A0ABY8QLT1_9RHOB|nr:hypothetical protein [Tropicibacter oceani]WGW05572.1 hypothetical protein QF118_08500 [Tropicibacter oceani]